MKILVVDDDENSRMMLEAALSGSGYDVVAADNGRRAVDKLYDEHPEMIISDILMPELDGYSLCRFVKSTPQFQNIPLIFYTATYVDDEDQIFGLSLGATRYVLKPADLDEFLPMVKELVDSIDSGEIDIPDLPTLPDAALDHSHATRLLAKLDKKISELDSARRTAMTNEARFRDFAETAADWFWETDDTLTVTLTTNYSKQLIGRSILEFLNGAESVSKAPHRNELDRRELGHLIEGRNSFSDIEIEWADGNGGIRIFEVHGKPFEEAGGGFSGYRGVCRDTTDATDLARRMAHAASHDAITGLLNRREFNERLARALTNHMATGAPYHLCFMDLDQFKVVNDTVGHVAGDAMLVQIAKLLSSGRRARDTLARLGGDEFGLLLENCPIAKATEIAENIVDEMSEYRFTWDGRILKSGISIGIATLGETINNPTDLLACADVACYAAKEQGRNQVVVYGGGNAQENLQHSQMFKTAELDDALDQGRFVLCAQVITPSANPTLAEHYELLIRMYGDNDELISPAAFIPAAERFGKMGAIERWVITEALGSHVPRLAKNNDCVVSINLSGTSFADPRFLDFLQSEIKTSSVDPEQICFEVTETAAIYDLYSVADSIKSLKDLGVKFALDDFGSGACSFTYLKQLPVDYVKIDGSFVKNITHDRVDRAMVHSICQLARVINLRSIAECVESQAIADVLAEMSVDYCQGFHFGRPDTIDNILERRAG